MVPVSLKVAADTASLDPMNASFLSHFSLQQLKMSFHSSMVGASFNISLFLASVSIEFSFLRGSYFNLPWILSHSPLAAVSLNISFFLAFISIKFSFLHGSYFILSWILSHSLLVAVSCNISFLLAFV